MSIKSFLAVPIKIIIHKSATRKVDGYSIGIENGPAYHVLPLTGESQQKVDNKFLKLLKRLINDGEI